MEALIALASLVLHGLLSARFGHDSRLGLRTKEEDWAALGMTWGDEPPRPASRPDRLARQRDSIQGEGTALTDYPVLAVCPRQRNRRGTFHEETTMLNVTTPPLTTRYLDQVKASLMDSLNHEVPERILSPSSVEEQLQPAWFDHFWFGRAVTMCGRTRLDNIQFCIEDCLARDVPGDVIECGVWRGGAAILMRAVLAAHEATDRTVWVADSFAGLPAPPPASVDERMYNFPQVVEIDRFAVDVATVQANFARYGLLDDQVRFLPGWFRDTLPAAPITALAVLRLDGDYYDSTMETLVALYPKVSVGGYVIIDDWGIDQICGEKEAVLDYRQANAIADEIIPIDYHSAFWRKST